LLHAFFTFLLLLKQFLFTADIAAITLRRYVLAQGLDRYPGNHLGTNRRLDGNIKHLARDQLFHLLDQLAPFAMGQVPVHNQRQGVDTFTVDQYIQANQLAFWKPAKWLSSDDK